MAKRKTERDFAIELGLMISSSIANGVKPAEILKVLEAKVAEEKSIGRTRAAFERTY